MKIVKYSLSVILLLSVVLCGVWLPECLAMYSGRAEINQIQVEEITPYKVDIQNSTTLLQKIELLNKLPLEIMQIALSTGDYYDSATANKRLLEEIETLTALGIVPDFDDTGKADVTLSVDLYIDKNNPSLRTVCWEITLRFENFWGTFLMDDETGKIFNFSVFLPDYNLEIGRNEIVKWGEYLGLKSINIAYSDQFVEYAESEDAQYNNILIESGSEKYLVIPETTKTAIANAYGQYTFELTTKDKAIPYKIYLAKNWYSFGNMEGNYYLIDKR